METHILFFILTGVLIAILVGYSLLSARREKSRLDTFATRPASAPLGSSSSATVSTQSTQADLERANIFTTQEAQNSEQWKLQEQEIQNQVQGIRIQLGNQEEAPVSRDVEPTVQPINNEAQMDVPPATNYAENVEAEPIENNLITLYVVAPEGRYFEGINIVQHLEALGLQYGEYQIFHRHLDSSSGAVLFSVANMREPGSFDLGSIDQLITDGVVFFMQIPSPANTNEVVNLRLMVNTAESLSKSLGGFVFDDNQQLFDENTLKFYLQRVKNVRK